MQAVNIAIYIGNNVDHFAFDPFDTMAFTKGSQKARINTGIKVIGVLKIAVRVVPKFIGICRLLVY